jgi:hypothetical protein
VRQAEPLDAVSKANRIRFNHEATTAPAIDAVRLRLTASCVAVSSA